MIWHVYSDGSCLENSSAGGPGGFAWVATFGDCVVEHNKGYFKTTNNRMELMAILDALSQIQEPSVVKIYTDSQYSIDCVTKWVYGWIRKNWIRTTQFGVTEEVKNKDLIQRLFALTKYHKVEFIKVKAHCGIPLNERCDVLAKEAAYKPTDVDEGFIPKSK